MPMSGQDRLRVYLANGSVALPVVTVSVLTEQDAVAEEFEAGMSLPPWSGHLT